MLFCISIFLNDSDNNNSSGTQQSFGSILLGIFILISVGFFGSIRNHYEQILCRDMEYNANFVVGMRSFISIFWTLIMAIILLSIPVLYENKNSDYNDNDYYDKTIITGWNKISDGIFYICSYPIFLIGFILFLLAIYGKNVTQMRVIELSSALTRNLTMQLMPIGTWLLSLIFYYINKKYGESWNKYSYIRLIGFVFVLIGSYLYMKVPKNENEMKRINAINMTKHINTNTNNTNLSDVDLYDGGDIILPTTPPSNY